jgi:F-type H+-transporting ATPase subunit delta
MAGGAAKRYARAIFELAQESGELDAWQTRLVALRKICASEEVRQVLDSPVLPLARRLEAAEVVAPDVGAGGLNLLKLLVETRSVEILDGIADEFEKLADESAGRVRATVTTAIGLADTDRSHLADQLTRHLGREVRLEARVDPAVLGGLVLRYGDRMIDGSVRTRLQQLRRRLAAE